MRDWLWHLFHDPIRDNPWSFGLILLGASIFFVLGFRPWKR